MHHTVYTHCAVCSSLVLWTHSSSRDFQIMCAQLSGFHRGCITTCWSFPSVSCSPDWMAVGLYYEASVVLYECQWEDRRTHGPWGWWMCRGSLTLSCYYISTESADMNHTSVPSAPHGFLLMWRYTTPPSSNNKTGTERENRSRGREEMTKSSNTKQKMRGGEW